MNGGDSQNINLADTEARSSISEKVLLSWQGESFFQSEKTLRWYLAAALVIVSIIAFSAWQGDWFMIGVVIVVSAVMFWYMHSVIPELVTYRLTPMGIYADDRFFPFAEMHSFWIIYNKDVQSLNIAFTKKYLPALTINLAKTDPLILKSYLLKKLPEQESRGESIIEKITRIVGL